jgi:hypothetical protein
VVAICLLFICAFGGAGAIVGVADVTGSTGPSPPGAHRPR